MKNIVKHFRILKWNDITGIIKFLISVPLSIILYPFLHKKSIWLVMETPKEAADNGYHFYNYVTKQKKENIYYAIDKKSKSYDKLKNKENVIQVSSLKHFIYYNLAKFNISTHKTGNPCNSVYYILHKIGFRRDSRIFLQHGITMNNVDYVNYKNAGFRLFVCGASNEYEFIKENFGYPKENIAYLGFSRFDNLIDNKVNIKQIVIMPSWRNYLVHEKYFENTEYFKKYISLLNNKKLIEFIEKEDITVYFYPHRNMQKYINLFDVASKNIKLATLENADIQTLLKTSSLMVTDYSSVSIDFAYMNKPLIYYQFDQEDFRKHLQKGYFSYEKDGFGPVLKEENKVVDNIIHYIKNNYTVEKKYQDRANNFFQYRDKNNSERIYQALKKIK